MEIQSAFNSGIQGLQKASEQVAESASVIAQETTDTQQAPAASVSTLKSAEQATSGLTPAIVNLKVAEVQAQASANVIKTADETLGTLLDVRV
jgi:hypothetical protein